MSIIHLTVSLAHLHINLVDDLHGSLLFEMLIEYVIALVVDVHTGMLHDIV